MTSPNVTLSNELQQALAEALADLQYGTIEVVVHESQVVQIERHERIRIPSRKTREGRPAKSTGHLPVPLRTVSQPPSSHLNTDLPVAPAAPVLGDVSGGSRGERPSA
ncbi:MAG: YezD family protein [Verrucomicrobiota bacterium]